MPEEVPQPIHVIEAPTLPLESDIDRVAGEVVKHKENPEFATASGQELVKHALTTLAATAASETNAQADPNAAYLPAYVTDAPAPTKMEIEHLLEMAFKEGIAKANAAAMKSSPFVLDAFHDALTGKLYPELKKRNVVD